MFSSHFALGIDSLPGIPCRFLVNAHIHHIARREGASLTRGYDDLLYTGS